MRPSHIVVIYQNGPGIGEGHKTRCLAIGLELQNRGHTIAYNENPDPATDLLIADLFDWNSWRQTLPMVDVPLVAITDRPELPFTPELVINPNLTGDGADHIILRREFDPPFPRQTRLTVETRLKVFGGPGPIKDMRAAMLDADLAVLSAGTLLHEACALGLPSLSVSRTDAEHEEALEVQAAGATWYLGPIGEVTRGAWTAAKEELADPSVRMEMSDAGMSLIDRLGRKRAVERIEGLLE